MKKALFISFGPSERRGFIRIHILLDGCKLSVLQLGQVDQKTFADVKSSTAELVMSHFLIMELTWVKEDN